MRPEKLFALFSDAVRLKGVGPNMRKALGRLLHGSEIAPVTIRDLAFHLPQNVIDRRNSPPLTTAKEGDIVTVIATVETHQPPARRGRLPYRVVCNTDEGYLTLVFFNPRKDYLETVLPVGARKVISGRFERYEYQAQITHPDIIAPPEELAKVQALEPVYGLTAGIGNRHLSKIIHAALQLLPELPEWLDEAYLKQQGWKKWKASLLAAHAPETLEDLSPVSLHRSRLAYDEILANQLALGIVRSKARRQVAAHAHKGELYEKALAHLPYQLTNGQKTVLQEIEADIDSGQRMLRLLQGDVGSGKTVVAMLAMLRIIEMGRQAALMVPTDLLGRQHYAVFDRMLTPLGIKVAMLSGNLKGKERADAMALIESGAAHIIIGTHALFQEKVAFKELGLAVIDEQHRFGVAQRMALTSKSSNTHMLVMTATPIPRTLTMTAFGDMDCSVLAEKPAGRIPIATKAVPLSRAEDVLNGIARATAAGDKVYWICPLVEESEEETTGPDLAAAQQRYIEFTHRFGARVAMVHGRMSGQERDQVMAGFAGNQYDILVATTVVEVGVDVPDATIIVIEHAERFGLAQMHQLRGRVGRGAKPSNCILLYADRCNDVARQRLRIIRESTDGFYIAEEDLKLRGAGDILGTRQSGLPDFHFVDWGLHYELLRTAHAEAKLILHQDAMLQSPRGPALKHLLYLFGYDENIRFIGAG